MFTWVKLTKVICGVKLFKKWNMVFISLTMIVKIGFGNNQQIFNQ